MMRSQNADSNRSRTDSTVRRLERELRAAIVRFELRPGQRVTELDIAIRYGVSRQPVREAFIGLDRAGLVTVQPQRGTVVVRLSSRRLHEAQVVRAAVAVELVRRGCAAFDAGHRAAIDTALAAAADAAQHGNRAGVLDANAEFHRALAAGCGVASAAEALENLKTHVDRAWWLSAPDSVAMLTTVAHHRAILAAIDARDPDAAAAAVRAEFADIQSALPRLEAEHPALFE
ncbi:transcriptional regulator [Blastochloris viridis]|uniref:Transcriptional regulator n=1 Tax=Blastochloris viridis TaxID=1079 RepID=A0A182CXD3_BLAVI|nr:transcriptional regulator [Blastochloris viridis]